jgi:hypothetical protein
VTHTCTECSVGRLSVSGGATQAFSPNAGGPQPLILVLGRTDLQTSGRFEPRSGQGLGTEARLAGTTSIGLAPRPPGSHIMWKATNRMVTVSQPRAAGRMTPAYLEMRPANQAATLGPRTGVFRRPAFALPRSGANARHVLREHHVDKQVCHRRPEAV